MKCRNCGKELKELRELTDEESKELDYIVCKESNCRQALSPDVLNKLKLTNEQFYTYIRANTDALADAIYCDNMFGKAIADSVGIEQCEMILENGRVYVHDRG